MILIKPEDHDDLKNHITLLNYESNKWEYATETINKPGYVIARLRFRISESKPLQKGDVYPALTIVSKKSGWKICGEAYEVKTSKEEDKRIGCFELDLSTDGLDEKKVVETMRQKFFYFMKKREREHLGTQKRKHIYSKI